jgi:hypothetical protein
VASAVGPAAFPEDACSLREGPPSPWRLALAAGAVDTTLVFDGAAHVDLRQWSALATASRRLSPALSLQLGAGALLGGWLEDDAGRHDLAPGVVAMASLSWLAVAPRSGGPFVALTTTLTVAAARTEAGPAGPGAPYQALDLALAGSVGWPIGGWLAPYAAAKVFGGPVAWERGGAAVTGTDLHHYQVAAGVAAALPGRFDLLLEVAPLGARAVSVAVGRAL